MIGCGCMVYLSPHLQSWLYCPSADLGPKHRGVRVVAADAVLLLTARRVVSVRLAIDHNKRVARLSDCVPCAFYLTTPRARTSASIYAAIPPPSPPPVPSTAFPQRHARAALHGDGDCVHVELEIVHVPLLPLTHCRVPLVRSSFISFWRLSLTPQPSPVVSSAAGGLRFTDPPPALLWSGFHCPSTRSSIADRQQYHNCDFISAVNQSGKCGSAQMHNLRPQPAG